jgi:siroheme synthase-like protein
MLPVVMSLRDQPVLVVGAGAVAAGKIRVLLEEGARVTVVSPAVLVELPAEVHYLQRTYREGDVRGFRLVIAAVGSPDVNEVIRRDADREGVWLNVVDNPTLCDFYFTAVHRSGDVVVSVSTQGASPALAQLVRNHIADTLPAGIGEAAAKLRERRREAHEAGVSTETSHWKDDVRRVWSQLLRS